MRAKRVACNCRCAMLDFRVCLRGCIVDGSVDAWDDSTRPSHTIACHSICYHPIPPHPTLPAVCDVLLSGYYLMRSHMRWPITRHSSLLTIYCSLLVYLPFPSGQVNTALSTLELGQNQIDAGLLTEVAALMKIRRVRLTFHHPHAA